MEDTDFEFLREGERSFLQALNDLGDRFDVVTTMTGLPDFNAEYARAKDETIGEVQVKLLPLERILHSKRAAGRQKDNHGVYQIELALKVLKNLPD